MHHPRCVSLSHLSSSPSASSHTPPLTRQQWSNAGYVPAWGYPDQLAVKGTDGVYGSRPLRADQGLAVYIDDIYRSVMLVKHGETEYHGMKLWRYGLSHNDLQNATTYPPNFFYDQVSDVSMSEGETD